MGNDESTQRSRSGTSGLSVLMESVPGKALTPKKSAPIMTMVHDHKKLIVAAIDFGTTYSGYAYSFKKDHERNPLEIHLNDWMAGKGMTKVPTTVLFTPEKKFHSFGFKAEDEYAKLCQKKVNENWFCFKKFKMQLHEKMVLKKDFNISDQTCKEMPALCIFTEAIKYLKSDLLKTLERRNPGFDESDIFWVLTIPAIWTEAAKQFMIKSAEEAGIHRNQLSLCLEPEAAALFCKTLPDSALYGSRDSEILNCFKTGGRYMILDLGGGTVDTAVHEVKSDGTLSEIIKSSGGTWGGTMVDEEFYSYIIETYGEESVTGLKKISPRDWLDLVNEFEMQKRKMTCDEETDLRLKLPTRLLLNSSQMIENQTIEHLYVKYKDFLRFFNPPTAKIESHVREVLSRVDGIRLILMVGGFAESEYVRGSLMKKLKDQRVIVPHDSSLAVLKGAVLYGFKPTAISARVCRFTYGIRVNRPFQEGIHPLENREVVDGEAICRNVFKVLVQEGEVVDINTKIEHEVRSSHQDETRRHIEMAIPIFASRNQNVLYTTDDACKMLGRIVIHPPKEGWPTEVRYRLLMEFGKTEFRIRVTSEPSNQEFNVTCDFLQ